MDALRKVAFFFLQRCNIEIIDTIYLLFEIFNILSIGNYIPYNESTGAYTSQVPPIITQSFAFLVWVIFVQHSFPFFYSWSEGLVLSLVVVG
jgi:hypothetical protein